MKISSAYAALRALRRKKIAEFAEKREIVNML
jgi:hypothetical protein